MFTWSTLKLCSVLLTTLSIRSNCSGSRSLILPYRNKTGMINCIKIWWFRFSTKTRAYSSLFSRCSILAQWVLRADSMTVPKKITTKLEKVKYLTSRKGLFLFGGLGGCHCVKLFGKGTLVSSALMSSSEKFIPAPAKNDPGLHYW